MFVGGTGTNRRKATGVSGHVIRVARRRGEGAMVREGGTPSLTCLEGRRALRCYDWRVAVTFVIFFSRASQLSKGFTT